MLPPFFLLVHTGNGRPHPPTPPPQDEQGTCYTKIREVL